ncbi:MAG: phage holin family protein [Coriobacteriia bacterium]
MAPSAKKPTDTVNGFEAVIDSVADLLQTAVDWLRQEAAGVVQEKIVAPIQRLGLTLASAAAAAALLVLGLTFIAVAAFLLLADWVGYPGALLIIGAVLMLGSIVFLVIKVRSMQK